VSAENAPGGGALFTVLLPVSSPPEHAPASAS